MGNEWFYFALLSPLIFAVVNIIDDNLLRSVYKSPFFGAIISGFFALLPLLALIFIPFSVPSYPIALLGISAGFLTTMYYLYYFKALESEYPSVVVALFGFSPSLVPFIAYGVLGEVLNINQYLGFVIILISSIAISLVDVEKFKFSKAFFIVFFASSIYAIIAVLSKVVYTEVDFWSGYMLFSIGMGLGAIFLSTFFKEGRSFFREFKISFKKWIWIFILVELIGISAELTNNLAISKGPVSLVKVIEGTQPMFVLLLALLFFPFFPKYFREAAKGDKFKKAFFMSVMLIGLYFIYSG